MAGPMKVFNEIKVVDFSSLKIKRGVLTYGKRIGFLNPEHKEFFPVNPSGEFGKLGIKTHSYLGSFFTPIIKIQARDMNDDSFKKFYLNKSETIEWLNAQSEVEIGPGASAQHVAQKIEELNNLYLQEKNKRIADHSENEKVYSSMLSKRRISCPGNRMRGVFWNAFTYVAHKRWIWTKLRFAIQLKEDTIDKASQILAIKAFKEAVDKVPAYGDFVYGRPIRTFKEVPPTSKDNYIKPALKERREASLYINGQIPKKAKRDTSTGTSGPSTPWYRGVKEQEKVEKMVMFAAKAILGDQPYTLINGFAMGPWATGVTATLAMSRNSQAGISVIGPNIDEIYNCIKEQVRIYGHKHPIVVCGYPPHLRAVVEKAVEEKFPMHTWPVIAIVGGESISEDLRDLLVYQGELHKNVTRTGFRNCYSSYGASDLDISIGNESDTEVEIRKLCHQPEHAALAIELFGKNEFIPMIFHYDPLNYYIESDENRKLYYTCVRGDRISPRIRYDLEDIGKIMPVSELLATLKKHGITLKNPPNTNLPFLFVWGRQGSHISFRGCKVAPENLGETIRRLDGGILPGLNEQVAHYGFYQYEEGGRTMTEILLEFNKEEDFNKSDSELLKKMIDMLAKVNTDFVAQIQACPPNERPLLRIFKKGESPMSVQQTRYPMRKKQYIFKKGDEFVKSHQEDMENKGKLIA